MTMKCLFILLLSAYSVFAVSESPDPGISTPASSPTLLARKLDIQVQNFLTLAKTQASTPEDEQLIRAITISELMKSANFALEAYVRVTGSLTVGQPLDPGLQANIDKVSLVCERINENVALLDNLTKSGSFNQSYYESQLLEYGNGDLRSDVTALMMALAPFAQS